MKREEKALYELSCGEAGTVLAVIGERGLCRRYADLGCLVGSEIRKLGVAPFGDPAAYLVCGTVLAIRKKDAAAVRLKV